MTTSRTPSRAGGGVRPLVDFAQAAASGSWAVDVTLSKRFFEQLAEARVQLAREH